jgi:hypothetical protein
MEKNEDLGGPAGRTNRILGFSRSHESYPGDLKQQTMGIPWEFKMIYPLVNVKKKLLKMARNREISHKQW